METPWPSLRLSRTAAAVSAACFALLASAALTACGASHAASVSTPPAPTGSVYQPPQPLQLRPPGTLIWAQKVPLSLDPPATVWRILYHSRNLDGKDVAVSGLAVVPTSAAPKGGRPVFAWAHGSAGQADRCAPSRDVRDNLPPYGGQMVGRGAALVATDYIGLGTPGEPTPDVGVDEAHAVLDSIRAARTLPGVGHAGPVILAGESQGGGAALWAAQLAHGYAPDLDVRGTVALAPAAQLTTILSALDKQPYRSYIGETLWGLDGLKTAYGSRLDLSGLLRPAARAGLEQVANQCSAQTIAEWNGSSLNAMFARNPLSVPSLVGILNENSPGATSPRMPIFLGQGSRDQEIPLSVSAELETRYCHLGVAVTRHVYAGADHDGVVDAATPDVLSWINARFHSNPAPSSCSAGKKGGSG